MISCENYDYIELVCTYRYPIVLHLRSGKSVTGVGIDTSVNEQREECITLVANSTHVMVPLNQIAVLEVTVDNPHINKIEFGRQ
ncbi:Rho-binding antiterminator [Alteromonas sp. KUL49]|uniref:Rho-binding antiterminator n=1 Tax=Alteromonas sp. KUL49 TaxID=2480798 RepID=UPI00102EEED2|nr:Rho-binding antiterminator [Alteromonas sp. KUL49]TAP35812.1 transcriptional regulator [Alteromonas sp. KUL49]GEA13189.1 hypothetical protein KUL49_35640 [Alteromonas sp. KUL49]